MRRWLLSLALSLWAGSAGAIDAFPGAQGWGKTSLGGRDGAIVYYTNLNDSGPGSLRACVDMTIPRVCIPRVSGVVALNSPLAVNSLAKGRLSLLCHHARNGVTLTNGPGMPVGPEQLTLFFLKNTQHVLIRHCRVRLTLPGVNGDPTQGVVVTTGADALTVEDSTDVYVDHFSGSWATDENFNAYSHVDRLTVGYSIFGEGIEGHSKCMLIGDEPNTGTYVSIWRNACVSNNDRNPDNNHKGYGCVEITNNIFYNADSEFSEFQSTFADINGDSTRIDYWGNYYKSGPNSNTTSYAITWNPVGHDPQNNWPYVFHSGNATWAPPGKTLAMVEPNTQQWVDTLPACATGSNANVLAAATAYTEVRGKAGAFPRDSLDVRLITEIGDQGTAGTGGPSGPAHNSVRTVPAISPGAHYVDNDNDGIADSQEATFGSTTWGDIDGDGYRNFEEFSQWLSERRIAGLYVQ